MAKKQIGCLGWIVLVVLGILALGWLGSVLDEGAGRKMGSEAEAFAISKQFVEDRLRSPSTAKFPWTAKRVDKLAPGHYMVFSHVDAQNAFGATVRSEYVCEVKTVDGTNWSLLDLQLTPR